MTETTVRYALSWGNVFMDFASRELVEFEIGVRRWRATYDPTSIFHEPLPKGEPTILRRTITTIRSDWEEADV